MNSEIHNKNIPIITIDGPSSSGKGTISKRLADALHWHFLDSGAIYRVFALAALRHKIAIENITALVQLAGSLELQFIERPGQTQQIVLAGNDVTEAIRSEECAAMASQIAVVPEVREALRAVQQSFRRLPGLVADGRDMGTVIFPDAQLKIFLTASTEERARRRLLQLQAKNKNVSLSNILRDLMERDARDQSRATAPLKPDPAAVIIDTTKLGIDEVLQQLLAHVKNMHL